MLVGAGRPFLVKGVLAGAGRFFEFVTEGPTALAAKEAAEYVGLQHVVVSEAPPRGAAGEPVPRETQRERDRASGAAASGP